MRIQITESEEIKSPIDGSLYSRYYLYLDGKLICSTCNFGADLTSKSPNELLIMAARELWGVVINDRDGVLNALNKQNSTIIFGNEVYSSIIDEAELYRKWLEVELKNKQEKVQNKLKNINEDFV